MQPTIQPANSLLDFDAIRAVVLDLDGVVWRGSDILPGVPDFFLFLRSRQIPYMLMTNNSSRSVAEYVQKIDAIGIPIDGDHILTSALVTAEMLAREFPAGTPLYVIGSESLAALLTARGNVIDPDGAQVVIVGLDVNLTYQKLAIATHRIRAGAVFIGTNADKTFPMNNGVINPGAGSILASLETATGVKPRVMGKPHAPIFLAALEHLGTPAAHTLMIGDRLDTDILGAQQAGLKTVLVLSGVSEEGDVEANAANVRPDATFAHLAEVLRAWQG